MANTSIDNILNPKSNYIINGAFQVDQRYASTLSAPLIHTTAIYNHASTTFANQPGYGPDRWVFDWDAAPTALSIYRADHTVGQADVPGAEKYLYWSNTHNTATYYRLAQRIENVNLLAGKQVGVSFYARGTTAYNVDISFIQDFGNGSVDVPVTAQTIAITTDWKYYQLAFNIPSISGQILDSAGSHNTFTELRLSMPVSNFVFNLSQVSGVEGYPRPYQFARGESWHEELPLMQRYFEKSYDLETKPKTLFSQPGFVQFSTDNLTSNTFTQFMSLSYYLKRIEPSFITYDIDLYGLGYVNFPSGGYEGAVTTQPGVSGARVYAFMAAPTTVRGMWFHWTADSEL